MIKRRTQTNKLYPVLSLCFWIGLWWLLAALLDKPLLLPTPVATIRALWTLAGTGTFYAALLTSLLRIVLGILLALVCGVLLAVLTTNSNIAHALFSPVLTLFKATPVASVIFLLLLWVGRGGVPFVIAFMMALPIVWSNTSEGLVNTDKRLLEMARVFRVPARRVFFGIRLPSLTPYFLAALRSAIALAWKAGIAAEVLCTPERSIGRAIYEGKLYLLTDELFAWTFVVIAISMLIERGALALLARAAKRSATPGVEQKEGTL